MTQALVPKSKVANKGTLEGILNGPTFQEALSTVLPKHLTPERVVKMALVAASRQPKLWECTKESFLQSIMKSAELGLDCSGTLGRAYLVPYYNTKIGAYECQFIPGYQGLIELARRSGNIARIESRVVHDNDYFDIEYGLDQKLVHKPSFTDPGDMKCVYAIAELTDGSRQMEIMTKPEIDAIRSRSKAKDSGPWVTDYPEMARKTVIRRLSKYLPLSTELEKAFEADDALFNGGSALDIADRTRMRVVEMKERLAAEETAAEVPIVGDVAELPKDQPGANENSEPVTNEPDADVNDDLDSETETIRSHVQELFDGLPKAQQKDIIAGRPSIGKSTLDELEALKDTIEGIAV